VGLESQPLSATCDSIFFDHSQLRIDDSFHAPLRWNVLARQSVEILVISRLQTEIGIRKVSLDHKGLSDGLVNHKLFAVIHDQCIQP
jgi:hypothetical protein